MKGYFANFLGDGGQPHVPVGTLVFLWMFCQAKRLAIEVKNGLITLKNGLFWFFSFILFFLLNTCCTFTAIIILLKAKHYISIPQIRN